MLELSLNRDNFFSRPYKGGVQLLGIILVGVVHDSSGGLIDREMDGLIQSRIVPLLSDQCVIVMEGGNRRGILAPHQPEYERMYRQLGPITRSGIRPIIHADDAMYHLQTEKELLTDARLEDAFTSVIDSFLMFEHLPTTWDEMISKLKDDNHQVRTRGQLSDAWKQYALRQSKTFNARDETFAQQILLHANQGKQVIFIAGVLHCITLMARYNWPVLRKECPPGIIENFYRCWYKAYAMEQWVT